MNSKAFRVIMGLLRITAIIVLGIIIYIVVLIESIVGVYAYTRLRSEPAITMEKSKDVLSATVPESGGSIIVEDKDSGIAGFTIEVTENTFDKDCDFQISTREITDYDFGVDVEVISPLIIIDNDERIGQETMVISMPIDIDEDEFAMFFYYRDDDTLEAVPFIYQDETVVIAQTVHFSDLLVVKADRADLEGVDINSGFIPGVDDWAFPNYGSQIAPNGHCSGQTATMIYYYVYKKKVLGLSLRDKFDNNRLTMKTPRLGLDDSLGYRLASVTQTKANFRSAYYRAIYNQIHYRKVFNDDDIYCSFSLPMLISDEPQMMSIRQRTVVSGEPELKYGHAVLVYRITGDTIFIADPNYPGQIKTISYDGTNLGDYVSTNKVGVVTKTYNSFAHVGVSGIYDMDAIGRDFKEAEKSIQSSSIGDGQFSDTQIEVMVDYRMKRPVYKKNTEDIILSPESMARIKERYKDQAFVPADWMDKNYVIIKCTSKASDTRIGFYRGSERIKEVTPKITKGDKSFFVVDIGQGKKDLGFLFADKKLGADGDSSAKYIHFHRLTVGTELPDFDGVWKGYGQITDASRSRILLEMVFTAVVRTVEAIINSFFSAFVEPGPLMTDEEVAAEVDRMIEEFDWSEVLLTVDLHIDKVDDKTYTIYYWITRDDELVEMTTTGKVRNGILRFKIDYKGFTFKVALKPVETDRLSGAFRLSLIVYGKVLEGKFDVAKE